MAAMKTLISLLWIVPCSIMAVVAFVLSLAAVAAASLIIAPVAIVSSSIRATIADH